MDAKYIALAIPFFFAAIGVEVWISRARGQENHRLYDAITSLSCGIGQQVIGVFLAVATVGAYGWVHSGFALFQISPRSPLAWIAILFLLDLAYYAVHRASHRVNVIWATHAVHHQSEDYNLATALRQSWFFGIFSAAFYLPLAVIGFPASMYVTTLTVNTLYQFWIHTRTVGKLGPLEWFLNTPSHHRVHHGIDPKYIDKNYAGMFILYDRLFGTFTAEEEEPFYGTVKPLRSFSSFQANFDELARIARLSRASGRLPDKAWAWLAPPEWRPPELGGAAIIPEVDRAAYTKFDVPSSRPLALYVIASFVVVAIQTTAYLWYAPAMMPNELAAAGAVLLLNLLAWGGLIEGKRWGLPLDLARLAASVGVLGQLARGSAHLPAILAAATVVALALGALAIRAARTPRGARVVPA